MGVYAGPPENFAVGEQMLPHTISALPDRFNARKVIKDRQYKAISS